MANSADPDQLASEEANWSGSTLFVKAVHVVFSRRRVKLNDLANEHKCFVFNGIYVRLTFFSGKGSQSCLDRRRDPGSWQHTPTLFDSKCLPASLLKGTSHIDLTHLPPPPQPPHTHTPGSFYFWPFQLGYLVLLALCVVLWLLAAELSSCFVLSVVLLLCFVDPF